ncbi:MAG: hypothetical protein ACW96U_08850 [Candidatus Heimdallarchaeaceae archaeon]
MNNFEIEKVLEKWFKLKPEYCNIEIAGRSFGGRYGESLQDPESFFIGSDILRINFHRYEILTIVKPEGVKLVEGDELVISSAKEVRFGWFYYGGDIKSVNWCEEIYRIQKDHIQFISIFEKEIKEETKLWDGEFLVYIVCSSSLKT